MKDCPKCNGEGFLIVEDIEWVAKECPMCEGDGKLMKVNENIDSE